MKKRLALLPVFLLLLATTTWAQKIGYCNSLTIMADLPEVKSADSDLQAYQAILTKQGQAMVKELETKAKELDDKDKKGLIARKDLEDQKVKLQAEESKIAEYEREVYAKLGEKRQELYKPIFDRVNAAIKSVAEELGYAMIFDLQTQVLLYIDPTLDVTQAVKAKITAGGKP